MSETRVTAECARCGGSPFFLTCRHVTGLPHDWTLAIICPGCKRADWTESGCLDCRAVGGEHDA